MLGFGIAAVVLLLLITAGWLVYLNSRLGDVPRFDAGLSRPDRPARVPGPAQNILLAGIDDGQGTDLLEALKPGRWRPGVFRSDAIMVLHIDPSRDLAQLVSIPRDSYVPVAGLGTTKINAALSAGGPALLVKTIEDYTGVRLDHVALVDFSGFEAITRTIGGVDVNVAATVTDTIRGITWQAGTHHVEGAEALAYVRQRYGLPGGDFDRIQRQQNFLRAVLDKIGTKSTVLNPIKLTKLTGELAGLIRVDDGFTSGELRDLALSSRSLRSQDLRFATAPYTGTPTIDGASVVTLDERATRQMFTALSTGNLDSYLKTNDVDRLPGTDAVR